MRQLLLLPFSSRDDDLVGFFPSTMTLVAGLRPCTPPENPRHHMTSSQPFHPSPLSL
jgi:hypothetical protein